MLYLRNNRIKEAGVSVMCISMVLLMTILFSFTARSQILTSISAATDSAVFQYVARVMLSGGVPYRDAFDHKGPLIYLINVLALWISPDKGLWIVEVVMLLFSFFLMYRLSRLFCNKITSVFVVLAILPVLNRYFEGGNLTEEYALPFIAGALYIFSDYFVNKKITRLRLFLCGAFLGAILLLRVNMIAVWIVMSLGVLVWCIYYRDYKRLFFYLGYFMLGLLVSIAPFIVWLAFQGALPYFWNDYILFNLSYSNGESANIYSKISAFLYFLYEPLVMVACGVMGVSFFKRKCLLDILYLFCVLVTLLLICISGRSYGHYGMVLIPILVIPLAYIGKVCDKAYEENQLCIVFLVVCLLVSSVMPTWKELTNNTLVSCQNKGVANVDPAMIAISSWVQKNTEEDDHIIVCGNWNIIYNLSNRFAASKYSYQSPLCAIDRAIEEEFFEELSMNKPEVIVLPNGFVAYNKMIEFINRYNYMRVYVDNINDNIELYIAI